MKQLGPIGPKITNESQARALVGISPEKRAQVIEIAAETAKADPWSLP